MSDSLVPQANALPTPENGATLAHDGLRIRMALAPAGPGRLEVETSVRLGVFIAAGAYPLLSGLTNPRFFEFERAIDFSKEFVWLVGSKIASVIAAVAVAATVRNYWAVIAGLVAAGEPYDPASVTAAFMRSGSGGAKDAPLRRRLNEVITAGADGFTAVHYADIVLSQSYRRSYRTVATAIVHAAEELPEEYLFDHLVEHGRAQRALWRRLNTFRAGQ